MPQRAAGDFRKHISTRDWRAWRKVLDTAWRLGPIVQIAKRTQVFRAELIQHLSLLTRGGTVDREAIAIDHAGVLNAESLDKYRQMRQGRARIQITLINMNGMSVLTNEAL